MKTTKRFLAAVLALTAITATTPMSAFAIDYNAAGNAATDVTWTSNAAYVVTIPPSVALGETATVSASNVILNAGEQLNVTLSGTSETDNAFKLTTATDSLTYTVSKGEDSVSVGDVVLNVAAGTTSGSSDLKFNEPATAPNAGDYTGTVTFTISVKAAKTDVSSVAIDDKSTTALTKGETLNLTATVDADATDKTITWKSSDDTVASVDNTGKVTANKSGTAVITVTATNGTEDTADDKTDTITITVTNPANGITLNKTALALTKGSNETLTATVDPTDADGTVTWSSNKTSVATVDSNGKVTAVGSGTATITATIGSKSAECVVTVHNPATGITLNKSTLTLTKGSNETLIATVSPADADGTVSWSSNNTSVATVDSNGKVTAVAKGSATITATIGDKSADCVVTVNPIMYTVSFSANGGTGTMSNVSVEENTEYTLPANGFTAPTGKVFDKWQIGTNTYTAGAKVTITGNMNVTAKWVAIYSVNIGTFTKGSVTANSNTAKAGDTVTLTVTPATDYKLDTLTVNDASNNPITVTNNKFTMPAGNVTVSATFAYVPKTFDTLLSDGAIFRPGDTILGGEGEFYVSDYSSRFMFPSYTIYIDNGCYVFKDSDTPTAYVYKFGNRLKVTDTSDGVKVTYSGGKWYLSVYEP